MTGEPDRLDVVVVGAAVRDVDPSDRTQSRWRLGGGVTYGALTLAQLGLATGAVIGVDSEAARAPELDLQRIAGVWIALAPLAQGAVFVNVETTAGRMQSSLAVSDPVPVDALPEAWRSCGAWLFAPVAGELPEAWAAVPPESAFVALGWQGLLRDLVPGQRVGRRPPSESDLLRRADLVGVGSDDLLSGVELASLDVLLRPGASVVLTRSHAGGLLLRSEEGRLRAVRRYPAAPASPLDPTGAGDAFLAALVAARLGAGSRPAPVADRPFPNPEDLRFAATVASLAVEGRGLDGIPDASAVRRRLREQVTRPG